MLVCCRCGWFSSLFSVQYYANSPVIHISALPYAMRIHSGCIYIVRCTCIRKEHIYAVYKIHLTFGMQSTSTQRLNQCIVEGRIRMDSVPCIAWEILVVDKCSALCNRKTVYASDRKTKRRKKWTKDLFAKKRVIFSALSKYLLIFQMETNTRTKQHMLIIAYIVDGSKIMFWIQIPLQN